MTGDSLGQQVTYAGNGIDAFRDDGSYQTPENVAGIPWMMGIMAFFEMWVE